MGFFVQIGTAILLGVTPLVGTFTGLVPTWPYRLHFILPMVGTSVALHGYDRVRRAKNTPRLHLWVASMALALCLVAYAIMLMVAPLGCVDSTGGCS